MCEAHRKVTVIYCCDGELELYRAIRNFDLNEFGRMIIPQNFKSGKTIVAICEGEIEILNGMGDQLATQCWH